MSEIAFIILLIVNCILAYYAFRSWNKDDNKSTQDCFDAVSRTIPKGKLSGNGTDETAQRNGMILALNIISKLMR